MGTTHDNHYVPRQYLKRWENQAKKVWTYRTLVSNSHVPLWRDYPVKAIAFQQDLYTVRVNGREDDSLEHWLDKNVEAPAKDVLDKVAHDRKLSQREWEILLRYVAAQDLRTPGKIKSLLHIWRKDIPQQAHETLAECAEFLQNKPELVKALPKHTVLRGQQGLPMNVKKAINKPKEVLSVEVEIDMGKELYMYALKRGLTHTYKVLLNHHWVILHPYPGQEWPTSDKPVICMDYNSETSHNLDSGWGKKHTNIIFPVDPWHLLIAEVGIKNTRRLQSMDYSAEYTTFFQDIICENAYRFIFAVNPLKYMNRRHKRIVDPKLYEQEKQEAEKWAAHENHFSECTAWDN